MVWHSGPSWGELLGGSHPHGAGPVQPWCPRSQWPPGHPVWAGWDRGPAGNAKGSISAAGSPKEGGESPQNLYWCHQPWPGCKFRVPQPGEEGANSGRDRSRLILLHPALSGARAGAEGTMRAGPKWEQGGGC